MIKRCRNVGLDEPEFALTDGFVFTIRRKPELAFKAVGGITGEVPRLLSVFEDKHSREELPARLGLKHRDSFVDSYLKPALKSGLIEMTIPGKPTSSKQKYRLTENGKRFLKGEG